MSSVARVCSDCGSASPWDARFCARCGRPLVDRGPAPRYYGALPPGPAFVLGCVLLVAAIVALVAGNVIVGILLLVLAVPAFAFFYGAARHSPASPGARRVFATAHHLRGWAFFAWEASTAWARTLRDVARLRGESRRLRREREPILRALGEAAYREDEPSMDAHRRRLREIDEELAKREQARRRALARARRRVEAERAAARPTERFTIEEHPPGDEPEG